MNIFGSLRTDWECAKREYRSRHAAAARICTRSVCRETHARQARLSVLLPPWSVLTNHLESTIAHAAGPNVNFCDGHVVQMTMKDYLSPTDTARRRWNNDNESHPETWR